MKQAIAFLIGVLIFATISSGNYAGYKQSDIYKKAVKRFNKNCTTDLDAEHIATLRERANSQTKQKWTKGAMLKDARKFSKEKGLDKIFNHCLVAIVHLERAPLSYIENKEKELQEKLRTKIEAENRKIMIDSLTEKEIALVIYREKYEVRGLLCGFTHRPSPPSTGGFSVRDWGRSSKSPVRRTNPITPAIGVFAKFMMKPKIVQVIDKDSALIQYGDKYFWLKANTKGYIDGHPYSSDAVHYISGTRQYQTSVGSLKTVFVIEFVDESRISQLDEIAIKEILAHNP